MLCDSGARCRPSTSPGVASKLNSRPSAVVASTWKEKSAAGSGSASSPAAVVMRSSRPSSDSDVGALNPQADRARLCARLCLQPPGQGAGRVVAQDKVDARVQARGSALRSTRGPRTATGLGRYPISSSLLSLRAPMVRSAGCGLAPTKVSLRLTPRTSPLSPGPSPLSFEERGEGVSPDEWV